MPLSSEANEVARRGERRVRFAACKSVCERNGRRRRIQIEKRKKFSFSPSSSSPAHTWRNSLSAWVNRETPGETEFLTPLLPPKKGRVSFGAAYDAFPCLLLHELTSEGRSEKKPSFISVYFPAFYGGGGRAASPLPTRERGRTEELGEQGAQRGRKEGSGYTCVVLRLSPPLLLRSRLRPPPPSTRLPSFPPTLPYSCSE